MAKKSLEFESERDFHKLYSEDPKNLQQMEKALDCKVVARGGTLILEGSSLSIEQGELFFRLLESANKQGVSTKSSDFHRFLKGWSPGHWKLNAYSERLTSEVVKSLPPT